MYYSYVEIEYVATSFSPARMDLALKLIKGMGIIAMTERERKRRVHRQESQRAQHVFSQID
jgi:hypothetical protein